MTIKICYSKKAEKFVKKNMALLSRDQLKGLIIKALQKLLNNDDVNIDLKRLEGELRGYYRIRKGNIRIVFAVENGEIIIVSVISIGFRGDIYK